jgi:arylsulfatase A-like enzyme/Flp pilus assembly protein TadD
MTRKLLAALVIAGPVLVLAIGVALMRGRARSDTQRLAAAALRGANVLLITIDTLRADHVGAYGSASALTPTFDAFAKDGLRFDHTYAHVPLTLPSHASLLTAAYPSHNRVRDNGTFHLDEDWPTATTALKAAGYRTGAFVGAFILDARFGLNRGFDVYDDRMLGSGSDLEVVQRNAEQVLAPAYDWITGAQPSVASHQPPWFAWIHLYDPHEPYTPPEPYRSRYASDPYDGEIAFADAALGAFTARLRSSGALANTLVVVTSDHGESLGEHGERTHGLFAYDATLRVPLVFYFEPAAATPRLRPIRHGVFGDIMRIVDVVPTVLDLVGAPPLPHVDGRTVRPFISGERAFDDPGSYFEALNANLTRDWAPLTGLVRERLKLIDLPVPEFYDLSVDPGEAHNRYARDRARARDLEARLDRIAKTAPVVPSAIDADAEARLRSLGYAVASSPKPARAYTADDDPKRLVHLNAALDDAAAMWARGDAAQAMAILRGVIRERPAMTLAYDRLAFMLRATGRPDEAASLLDGAARAGHADRALVRSLGVMLRDAGDLQRSASVLEPLARNDPADLQTSDALGQTYARMGRAREAETLFKRVLAISPNAAATWNNLGAAYLGDGRVGAAVEALSRAVAINPALATAHNGLGVAYARRGEMDRAVAEWRRALDLRPGFPDALYNLERAETKKGPR